MKFCPKCGTQCTDAMKFCQNCGSPLPPAANTQRSGASDQYQTRNTSQAAQNVNQPQNENPYQQPTAAPYPNAYQNQYQNPNYVPVTATRSNGFGIAALVLGLVGIFVGAGAVPSAVVSMGLSFVFLIPSMLAIVFGIAGIAKRHADPTYGGYGLAIAGLVLGLIFFFIYLGLSITAYNVARTYSGIYGFDISDILSDLY